jgi:hypothetical protein
VNNERLRLPRHTYGTTSNKQTKEKQTKLERRKVMFMMIIHGEFVVDLNDSSIFDEFLEYVDLINVYLEIILHWLIEMMILNNLNFEIFLFSKKEKRKFTGGIKLTF